MNAGFRQDLPTVQPSIFCVINNMAEQLKKAANRDFLVGVCTISGDETSRVRSDVADLHVLFLLYPSDSS